MNPPVALFYPPLQHAQSFAFFAPRGDKMNMNPSSVRPASSEDFKAIIGIYNEAIRTSTATFDLRPRTPQEDLVWFKKHGPSFPLLVITDDVGKVCGWGALSPYSDREGYSQTCENSLYIAASNQGRGLGSQLLEALLEAGRKSGLREVLGRITEGNEASLALHKKFGFRVVGTLENVGVKFDRTLSVTLVQKSIATPNIVK